MHMTSSLLMELLLPYVLCGVDDISLIGTRNRVGQKKGRLAGIEPATLRFRGSDSANRAKPLKLVIF